MIIIIIVIGISEAEALKPKFGSRRRRNANIGSISNMYVPGTDMTLQNYFKSPLIHEQKS